MARVLTRALPVAALAVLALTGCDAGRSDAGATVSTSAVDVPTVAGPPAVTAPAGQATTGSPAPRGSGAATGPAGTTAPGVSSSGAPPSGAPSSGAKEQVTVSCNAGACRLDYPAAMPDAQVRAAYVARAAQHPAQGTAVRFGVLPLGGRPSVPAASAPQGKATGTPLARNVVVEVTCAKELTQAASPTDAFWYRMADGRWVSAPHLVPVEKGQVPPC